MEKLKFPAEEGMGVIVVDKFITYLVASEYQIVIEVFASTGGL